MVKQKYIKFIGTFMIHLGATDLLHGPNPAVFNPWPARLDYAAHGHICKLYINYKKNNNVGA
jgi:hypothetical protein